MTDDERMWLAWLNAAERRVTAARQELVAAEADRDRLRAVVRLRPALVPPGWPRWGWPARG